MCDWANWVHAGKITPMDSFESKSEIRQRVISQRPQPSTGLAANLVRLAFELDANVIASYQPLANEPDVAEFNLWVISMGKTLLLPRIEGEHLVFADGDLVIGSHGIYEPTGSPHDLAEAQLIFNWEATADDVSPLIHAHPTLSEAMGEAHMALAGKPLHAHG